MCFLGRGVLIRLYVYGIQGESFMYIPYIFILFFWGKENLGGSSMSDNFLVFHFGICLIPLPCAGCLFVR